MVHTVLGRYGIIEKSISSFMERSSNKCYKTFRWAASSII